MPRPHVVFINRSYWPDAEATGQLLTELAEDLAHAFDVTVICGQPVQNPTGAEFRRRGSEIRHGVRVVRLPHTRFDKSRFLGRLANMLSFLAAASLRAAAVGRADLIVVETDPPLLCLLGGFLQRARRQRLVCYLQDIYPDVAVALGKLRPGRLSGLLARCFHAVYRRADRVVVLSRDMRQHLAACGVPEQRIACIPNWVDTRAIQPVKTGNAFRRRHRLDGKFVVMYSGNLGLSQDLDQLLRAADALRGDPRYQFLLIGGGANRRPLEARARALGLSNTTFLDYQPQSELSQSLSAADLHVVYLDRRITHCLMPSKLYGILASGTPLLAIADPRSELAALVDQQRVGRVVPHADPLALAQAIRAWAEDPDELQAAGGRARLLAEQRFDRRISVDAFSRMLQAVCGRTAAAGVAGALA